MAESTGNKLTPNECRYWQQEVKSCENRQKRELIERNAYPQMINYYEGDQYDTSDGHKKLAIINEYFPNVNSLIAEIMYKNPDIIVESQKPDAEENAPIMQSALNYAFKKLDALTENRIALFDMLMAGYCAVEVNHINTMQVENVARPGGEEKSLIGKVKDKIRSMTDENYEAEVEKVIPTAEEKYSTPDETYIRRWNPLNILLDYKAERTKDMRYIVKVINMSHAEFAARYPKFKDKVNTTSTMPYSLHSKDQDKKSVTLYEFQLKKKDKYVHFIISGNYSLGEIDYWERPYTTNGFNIKIGTLHKYGKLYPISMAKINKSIQDDLNNYTTFMMEVAEKNIPKRWYNKTKVKEDGLRALNSNIVNQAVPVEGGQESIGTIPNTNVSAENKELIQIFDKQKDKLWSVTAQRTGQLGKAKFATELEIAEAGFIAQQSDIQEGLRQLLREEVDTLKDIIVQFWDGPMWFKVTDSTEPTWYQPQQDPLTGQVLNPLTDLLIMDYECDVDIQSSLKPNKEKKKKDLIDFATWITSPNVLQFAQMQKYMIDIDVIRKVAKEWGWNPDSVIKPLPDTPQGQMMQQEAAVPGSVEKEADMAQQQQELALQAQQQG